MLGAWVCRLTGKHRWEKRLSEVPEDSFFYRVDCERCGEAMDAAALRRLCARLSEGAKQYALDTIGMKP